MADASREPLALKLLKLPYYVILTIVGTISYVWTLPLYVLISIVQQKFDSSILKTQGRFYMYIFRWLLLHIGLALIISQFFFSSKFIYDVTLNEGNIVASIATISFLISTGGFVWGGLKAHQKFNKWVPKSEFKLMLKNLLESEKDLGAFLCCIGVFMGVLRIWHLVSWTAESKTPFHRHCYVNFGLTFLEWLCLPFWLIICLLAPWRLLDLKAKWNQHGNENPEWYKKKLLVITACDGIVDLPFYLFAIPVICSWRATTWWSKMKQAKTNYRRVVCLYEFLELLKDLPFAVLALVVSLLIYRAVPMWKDVFKAADLTQKRKTILNYFLCVILDPIVVLICIPCITLHMRYYSRFKTAWSTLSGFPRNREILMLFKNVITDIILYDIPIIACVAFSITGPWRWKNMAAALTTENVEQRRRNCVEVALCIILDFPTLICYGIIMCTWWHANSLRQKLEGKDLLLANKIVLKEFKEWLGHLPYMLLLLVTLSSGWRTFRCLAQLRLCNTNEDKRKAAVVQAQMVLLDLPCGYAGLVCLLSGWCSKEAYQIIKEVLLSCVLLTKKGDRHLGTDVASFDESSLNHFRLLTLVGRLATDITLTPFLLLVVLFPWRYINWQRNISKETNFWNKRRNLVEEAWEVPFDAISMACVLLLFISWRSLHAFQKLKTAWVQKSTIPVLRKIVFAEIKELGLDAPYAIMFVLMMWRLPYTFSEIRKQTTAIQRRNTIGIQSSELLRDLPYVIPFIIDVLAIWRLYDFGKNFIKLDNGPARRRLVFVTFSHAGLDFLCAIPVLLMIGTLWRSLSLFERIKLYRSVLSAADESPKESDSSSDSTDASAATNATQQPEPAKVEDKQFYVAVHLAVFAEFKEWMKDLPFIPFAIVVGGTMYRIPSYYTAYQKYTLPSSRRRLLVTQSLAILLDILCTVLGVTIWRINNLMRKISAAQQAAEEAAKQAAQQPQTQNSNTTTNVKIHVQLPMISESHSIIIKEFVELMKDMPYVALLLVLFWRMPSTLRYLLHSMDNVDLGAMNRRMYIADQFIELLKDIPYIPFVAIDILCFWRLGGLTRKVKTSTSDHTTRSQIMQEALFGLADIATFLEAVVITLTGWRAYSLYKLMRDFNKRKADQAAQQAQQPAPVQQPVPAQQSNQAQPAVPPTQQNPPQATQTNASNNELERHKVIHAEFMEWLRDLPYIPFALFSGVGFWRYSRIVHDIKTSQDNMSKRRSFVRHSGLILIDLTASAAVAIVMITAWRAYLLVQAFKKMRAAPPAVPVPPPSNVQTLRSSQKRQSQPVRKTRWEQLDEWHRVAFSQLSEWVKDLPYIPLFVPILVTGYRLIPLWKMWKASTTDQQLRLSVVAQLKLLGKDLLCIPLVIVMLLTLWRSISLLSGLTEQEEEEDEDLSEIQEQDSSQPSTSASGVGVQQAAKPTKKKKITLTYHDVIFQEFLDLLQDIPYVITFALLGLRLPETVVMLFKEKGALKRRQLIASQFSEMIQDIPYVPMLLCLMVTVWRVPILYHRIFTINDGTYKMYQKNPSNRRNYNAYIREEIQYHFVALPRDILCLILGAILLVTGWRVYFVYTHLGMAYKARRSAPTSNSTEADVTVQRFVYHNVIMYQFKQLMLDTPYVILFWVLVIIGPWRVPLMVKRMYNSKTNFSRRKAVRDNLSIVISDIICGLMSVLVIITGWRAWALIRDLIYMEDVEYLANIQPSLHMSHTNRRWHVITEYHFSEWTKDIPYVPLAIIVIGTGYRVPGLYREYKQCETSYQARREVVYHVQLIGNDAVCLLIGLVLVCTIYRIKPLYTSMRKKPTHETVYSEFSDFMDDLHTVYRVWFILITCTHWYSLGFRLYHMRKYSRDLKAKQEREKVFAKKNAEWNDAYSIWHFLPKDVKVEIFQYFNDYQLCTMAEVNKECRDLSETNTLWAVLLQRKFNYQYSVDPRERKDRVVSAKKIFKQKELASRGYALPIKKQLSGPAYDVQVGVKMVIQMEYRLAIKDLAHTFLLPFKILSVVFLPIYYYHQWRIKRPQWSIGYLYQQVGPLPGNNLFNLEADCVVDNYDFWRAHYMFFGEMLALLAMIENELESIFVLIHFGFIVVSTAGTGSMPKPVKVVVELLQSLLFPAFIVMEFFLLLAPISYYNQAVTVDFVKGVYQQELTFWELIGNYWTNMYLFYWKMWLLQLVWLGFMLMSGTRAQRLSQQYMPGYAPFQGYVRTYQAGVQTAVLIHRGAKVVAKVLSNAIIKAATLAKKAMAMVLNVLKEAASFLWIVILLMVTKVLKRFRKSIKTNDKILAWCCKFCFKRGLLGEILLIPMSFTWVLWPLLIPAYLHSYALLIPAGSYSFHLMRKSRKLINDHWNDKPIVPTISKKPMCTAESITVKAPAFDGHGIRIAIRGTKPKDLAFKSAVLRLEGELFWKALERLLGKALTLTFKFTMYPISLCPTYFNPTDFVAGKETFETEIVFGTGQKGSKIKFKDVTLMDKLKVLKEQGDPYFVMRIDYGEESFATWKCQGTLLAFETKASQLMQAVQSGTDLVKQPSNIWM